MELMDCQNVPIKKSETLASEMKDYLTRHEARVVELIAKGDDSAGKKASAMWSQAFDGLLSSLFCAVRHQFDDDELFDSVALGAVGSYGRDNFALKSDLDVRILCPKPERVAQIAEALLYPLWDAGVQIGHQVVTQGELLHLAKTDLPTATTLLDWRHLMGNREASNQLKKKAFDSVFSNGQISQFLEELHIQSELRWGRFGDSVYLLEPDLKNGRGGVRDLDILSWIAQARFRVPDLAGLVKIGVLLEPEFEEISEASQFLQRVRNILHFGSRRRTDRLGFEGQEQVAEVMGYGTGGAGCELMMSEYYRHARTVSNSLETLFYRARPTERRRKKVTELAPGIEQIGEEVALARIDELYERPELALGVYWEAVQGDLPVEPRSRDEIARALKDEEFCEQLRANPQAATYFRRLVRQPRDVKFKRNSLLSEFHDVGLLLAMIPEFAPVVGRVHHDIYHVYTVDVHSIACVDKLRSFCRGSFAKQFPIASRLAADIARPQVLFMAALLHDIGKDEGGRNHADRGVDLSRPILERLGVQEHDIIEIQHLVRKHLRMYHVASRRDIDDPKTIEDFRSQVHGTEGLKELYILTLCDVSTTSPNALTEWKARMMEELYIATRVSFDGLDQSESSRAENLKSAALALCPDPGEREFLQHFLSSVPHRYLHANEPNDIVEHARLARFSERRRFVGRTLKKENPYAEVGFIADDRPRTLEMIAASLTANRLRVAGAQLYTWQDSLGQKKVLDLFWVRAGQDPELVQEAMPKLEKDFESLRSGEIDPEELIHRRHRSGLNARPAPDVEVSVSFDNRCATAHTVIEVIAPDRPGLLYRLAKSIGRAGLSVGLAKINTEGNAVADVFYVLDAQGKKLVDPSALEELREALLAVVHKTEN